MDLKKTLFNTIGEIKTPERKLNVLFPLSAVIVLGAVVWFLFNSDNNNKAEQIKDFKEQVIELRQDITILRHEKDSLIFKSINDKAETIKKLGEIIEKQEKQKVILRNLK